MKRFSIAVHFCTLLCMCILLSDVHADAPDVTERWFEGELFSFGATRPDPAEVAANLREFPKMDFGRTHFDWRDLGGVTPAKNQRGCGACWAFAVTGTLESHYLIEYGIELDLSEQTLLSCATEFRGCCGGNSKAFQFYYDREPVLESCYPFGDGGTSCSSMTCPPDCSSVVCDESCPGIGSLVVEGSHFYVDVEDPDAVIATLELNGPAWISYGVHTDFLNYWRRDAGTAPWTDGIYINNTDSYEGGHAVLLIGYDTEHEYWICKNSWGVNGGPFDDGTFKIKWSGHAAEVLWGVADCEITNAPYTPVPPTPTGTPPPTPTPTDTPVPPDNDTCAQPENYLVGQCICDTIYGATNYHDCGDGHDGGDRVYAFHGFNPGYVYELRGNADFNADWTVSTVCSSSAATVLCTDRTVDAVEPSCGYVVDGHPYGQISTQWTAETSLYYVWVDARYESMIEGDYCLEVVMVATPTPTPLPRDLHVPGDYPTIQEAIDAAMPGDRVVIANGVYRGSGNTDLSFHGKPITVQSLDGPYFCIIDCEGVHTGVVFEEGETSDSVLRGLTIRYGGNTQTGGGIRCYQSSPMITDCRFERNVAGQYGGGIYCEESNATISHCTFEFNESGYRGGALCCIESSPIVTNCALVSNFATDLGGAVYCNDYASPSFRNITCTSNSTDNEGGGFAIGVNSSPTIINSILFYDDPGEIYLIGGSITVTYSDVAEGWTGQGNTDAYPRLMTGPLGDLYLDAALSPCINAGSTVASNVWFNLSSDEILYLDELTTRTDGVTDSGIVDMGYHYPLGIPPTSTPTPTPFITATPTPHSMMIRVPQDYTTIQAAIDAAAPGYTVLVDDGTYTGTGNRNLSTRGKAITLRSANGPATCIIDCENLDVGFRLYEGETQDTIIQGFTVRNGQKTSGSNFGGGIVCLNIGCTFIDCIVENCLAQEGGGIYTSSPMNNTRFFDCIIRGNTTFTDYGFGGGIYISSGTTTMTNCLIVDNNADSGGGVGISGIDTIVNLTNCTITGNHTLVANRTGGLYNSAATLTCDNCIIYGNEYKNLTSNGTESINYCDVQKNSGIEPGPGNINADPLFESGPFGSFYLNPSDGSGSPCLDAGNQPASDICFDTVENTICLDDRITDPFGSADAGTVDMGYHYPSADPDIIRVPQDFDTIQAAIDAASDLDIVLVAPGMYSGEGNRDLDFHGKNIVVRAVDGPETTRLLLGNTHRGAHFYSGEPVTAYLDGFAFISGYSTGHGGAILCSDSSPSIVNCLFESCHAAAGGAIAVDGGQPRIANCRFNGNFAEYGGALELLDTQMEVTNCALWENGATEEGGAVYLNQSSGLVHFQNCTFFLNTADDGGGIAAYASELAIQESILWSNTPNQIASYYPVSTPDIDYCDIQGGWSPGNNMNADPYFYDGPDGGVLYLDSGILNVSPCISAGSQLASQVYFSDSSGVISLNQMTTDPLGLLDTDTVDMGFHYMNPALFTPTPGPTQPPTATPAGNCSNPAIIDIDECVCDTTDSMSSDHDCGFGHGGPDRVYRIDVPAPGGILTLQGRADFDADWSIGTQCDAGANIVCIDGTDEPVPNPECSNVTPDALGDIYYSWQGSGTFYIWVDGFHGWDSGNYCLQVNLGEFTPTPSPTPILTATPTPLPRDIYVPGDYDNIGEAIEASRSKDKIYVGDGTWSGIENTNLNFQGKRLVIQSQNGPAHCIIDGSTMARAFTFDTQETNKCILSGFTFRNCVESVVLCRDASPLITNCVFSNNDSTFGGAIRCEDNANPQITNCLFESNTSTYNGGAVAVFSMSDPTFTSCTFSGNIAQSYGGALSVEEDSSIMLTYCIGWGDSAGDGPEEIYLDDSVLTMSWSNFQRAAGGTYPGTGILNEDPMFQSGPYGDYYLLDEAVTISPCVDAGNVSSQSVCFTAGSTHCMNTLTTHVTGYGDTGLVDLGFHYEPYLMPTFTPEPTWLPEPTITPTPPCIHHGDVNFSGSLTAGDAQMIFNIVLGFITPTVEEYCAADCNGNDTVTAGDSQSVFYAVLGIGEGCVDPVVLMVNTGL